MKIAPTHSIILIICAPKFDQNLISKNYLLMKSTWRFVTNQPINCKWVILFSMRKKNNDPILAHQWNFHFKLDFFFAILQDNQSWDLNEGEKNSQMPKMRSKAFQKFSHNTQRISEITDMQWQLRTTLSIASVSLLRARVYLYLPIIICMRHEITASP